MPERACEVNTVGYSEVRIHIYNVKTYIFSFGLFLIYSVSKEQAVLLARMLCLCFHFHVVVIKIC